MMGDVIDLQQHRETNTPHRVAEVICVKCLHRYVCVWPDGTPLKHLHCEKCGPGYIITTGEPIE